jgi:hypothetical protein
MSRPYEVEQVAEVSSPEVARQVARLQRVDFAVEENRQTDGRTSSDWGSEDGRIAYGMGEDLNSISERFAHKSYELSVLYGLQVYSPKQAMKYLTTKILAQTLAGKRQVNDASELQTVLAYDGYERVGGVFIELSETAERVLPTVGAYAAVAYMRGNIKNPVDRAIYDRKEEIAKLVEEIEGQVPIRTFVNEGLMNIPRKGLFKKPKTEPYRVEKSVFNYSWRKNSIEYGDVSWWWDELSTDLSAIDIAAEKL